MKTGKLYGVGVGPGAPDLVTLRALTVMRSVDVLALPRSNDWGESMAWKIVASHLENGETAEKLFLTFPMNKDPERLKPAIAKALDAIGERLATGRSVAFVTEGDPSLYSTFIYVAAEARRRFAGLEVEIVPAVSSPMAVAAVTGVPLADGQERIAIIPGNYGVGDLDGILRAFDTIVLMKIGPEMPQILAALERCGLVDRAIYVAKATMTEQRIVRDLTSVKAERGDCFAMVIVSKKERAGVLVGESPPAAIAGEVCS
ncbi:MAG TPA: precorrin-2 C(20)-methyltransferase [Polyangia bacterium]|nr:precorrin-2 C(20)-methyltransferase [Polyangia bacterium]